MGADRDVEVCVWVGWGARGGGGITRIEDVESC
jgi:hypothetical protein